MVAAIHESAHTCFNYFTGRGVFTVELDGDGGTSRPSWGTRNWIRRPGMRGSLPG
jgi:hypothetical protein